MSKPVPVVMCPPTYFGVEYVINPWMEGHIGLVRREVAQRQWDALHEHVSARTEVRILEPGPHLPDMCFVANAGLVLGDTFVPSVFRVPQRAPEVDIDRRWFRERGYRIAELPDDQPFEGEGDALFHPGTEGLLWAGYGVRSSLESHRTLSEIFNCEVVSLRLIDERFYHLDTCFTPLPEGRVMYYANAFDEMSLRAIERKIPVENRLLVPEADALRFACNAVRIGRTIVLNHAGPELRAGLGRWGYEVVTTSLEEFMLAGGAAKCLTLYAAQETIQPRRTVKPAASPIRDAQLELHGHLLDTALLNRALDIVTELGGSFRVEQFNVGERHDQPSVVSLRVSAPTEGRLDDIVGRLLPLGARVVSDVGDVRLEPVKQAGVAPEDFYSTTIYPTDVRVDGRWVRATQQRMDAMLVVDDSGGEPAVRCTIMRDLRVGQKVVCGVRGVRVTTPPMRRREGDFAFMSASVSSERRVELAVEELAWEMKRIRARGGKIVFVAGPVVIHTGGAVHLARLIRRGYVQALLAGNALPAHDIEMNLYGTSLGVDLARGVGVHGGHQHHLKAINMVRAVGSIRAAVEQGIITGGVMYECVRHNVEYVLAGSIRDDGPLPDTMMDLIAAQTAYTKAIEGAEMIIMLSTMLHAIGTGNMTPAGVRLICVDISPAVVTKLADRGSVESTGIVTDVGLFLSMLAARLDEER